MDFTGGGFNAMRLLNSQGITTTNSSNDGFFVYDGKVKNYYVDSRYKTLSI